MTDPECGCRNHLGDHEDGRPIYHEHHLPKTLTHLYPLPALGAASVPLYRGPFESNGKKYEGLVELGLPPIPRIRAQGRRRTPVSVAELHEFFTDDSAPGWVDRPWLTLPGKSTVPEPPPTSRFSVKRVPGASWVGPFVPAPLTLHTGADVEHVTFYVVNGWRANDGLTTCHDGAVQRGRLQVTLGQEWDLRVEPRGDQPSKSVIEHMRTTGGHTITHVGRLRRADGTDFTADDALPVLHMLDDLFSFAVGRVVSTVLPVGWKDDQPVWTHWAALRAVDTPAPATSWLDEMHTASQLADLVKCGFTTYQDTLRASVFKNALDYYLTANFDSPGTMSTLLPVSGLQVLAYGHFVETLPPTDPAHVKPSQWENRATQGILRDIVSLTGVDLSIPSYLTHLTTTHANAVATAAKNKTAAPTDPLGSIVKMRNSVAHPSEKALGKWTSYHWTEAGLYTMYLFDVTMLWWLKYHGVYRPRTDGSTTTKVPWSPSTPTASRRPNAHGMSTT